MSCVVCQRPGERRSCRAYGTPIHVVLCQSCVGEFTALSWVTAEESEELRGP